MLLGGIVRVVRLPQIPWQGVPAGRDRACAGVLGAFVGASIAGLVKGVNPFDLGLRQRAACAIS